MTTRTRVKKIDADTHFLPPVDVEELRQFLPKNYNKEAVNDYPHPPSTFPNTAAGIENMVGLSEKDKENILGGNLMRVFGLT